MHLVHDSQPHTTLLSPMYALARCHISLCLTRDTLIALVQCLELALQNGWTVEL